MNETNSVEIQTQHADSTLRANKRYATNTPLFHTQTHYDFCRRYIQATEELRQYGVGENRPFPCLLFWVKALVYL